MARIRKIPTNLFDSKAFRDLSGDATKLYLWLRLNHYQHLSGICRIHRALFHLETGLAEEVTKPSLDELLKADLVGWDPDHSLVWVKGMLEDEGRGKSIVRAAKNNLASLPPKSPLITDFLERYPFLRSEDLTPRPSTTNIHPPTRGVTGGVLHPSDTDTDTDTDTDSVRVLGAGEHGALFDEPAPQPDVSPREVVEAWNEICGETLGEHRLTDALAKKIRTRITNNPGLSSLRGWQALFRALMGSDWHAGRESDWSADLRWLTMSDDNVDKIRRKARMSRTEPPTDGPPPGYTE